MKIKEEIEKYMPYSEQEINDIEEATKITNEEKMKPIYAKLNSKIKNYKG